MIFLHKVNRDTPKELSEYLAGPWDWDTVAVPIVKQVIDRIVAGDERLYKLYEEARVEAGQVNPYGMRDEVIAAGMGRFLKRWAIFEKTGFEVLRREDLPDEFKAASPYIRAWLYLEHILDRAYAQQLRHLRMIRNRIVHDEVSPYMVQEADALLMSTMKHWVDVSSEPQRSIVQAALHAMEHVE